MSLAACLPSDPKSRQANHHNPQKAVYFLCPSREGNSKLLYGFPLVQDPINFPALSVYGSAVAQMRMTLPPVNPLFTFASHFSASTGGHMHPNRSPPPLYTCFITVQSFLYPKYTLKDGQVPRIRSQ